MIDAIMLSGLTNISEDVYTMYIPFRRNIMEAHIQKWGNSLGLRIPMQIAKQLRLHAGSQVILKIENGQIIIQSPKYNLDEMLKNITNKNRHHQILDDDQQGNEEW